MNKSRQPRRAAAALYRPVATGWQKWLEREGGAWEAAAEGMELADLKPSAGSLIAVPVRRAFSLALWVPAADPQIFGDLIYTQLELRGLAARTRSSAAFAWEEIATEGDEALLHVVVLPQHLAPRYWHGDVINYAVSAACLPLAPDAVTLWREEGGWVSAVTRGGKLLHFQPLTEQEPGAQMALEVWLMLAPLEAGHMMPGPVSAALFYEGDNAPDLESWRSAGGIPVEARPLPPPVRPPQALDCVPTPVREVQEAKEIGARRQRFALVAAAVYFAVVLVLAANTIRLSWSARGLQQELDRDAATVTETTETMKRWEALSAAIDPLGYPLEVLYQTARLLPKDGVRLTLFEMNLGRVVIQGEASTFPAAQRFQDDVKKNPELEAYDWTAENPRSLPNGSARFQIDGVRRGAVPEDSLDQNEDVDI